MRDTGLDCHVKVAPVLPHLTDSEEQLDALLSAIAAAGGDQRLFSPATPAPVAAAVQPALF